LLDLVTSEEVVKAINDRSPLLFTTLSVNHTPGNCGLHGHALKWTEELEGLATAPEGCASSISQKPNNMEAYLGPAHPLLPQAHPHSQQALPTQRPAGEVGDHQDNGLPTEPHYPVRIHNSRVLPGMDEGIDIWLIDNPLVDASDPVMDIGWT
jgi:hypothetical protein